MHVERPQRATNSAVETNENECNVLAELLVFLPERRVKESPTHCSCAAAIMQSFWSA